jgi:hypothetical protein
VPLCFAASNNRRHFLIFWLYGPSFPHLTLIPITVIQFTVILITMTPLP